MHHPCFSLFFSCNKVLEALRSWKEQSRQTKGFLSLSHTLHVTPFFSSSKEFVFKRRLSGSLRFINSYWYCKLEPIVTGFLPGHCISHNISFLQLEWWLSYSNTMPINIYWDQVNRVNVVFLLTNLQLLSIMLMILPSVSIFGGIQKLNLSCPLPC